MNIKKVKLACFSPTGTSRSIAKSVSKGLKIDKVELIDATKSEVRQKAIHVSSEELLIIAVPVYKGRVPEILGEWLRHIKLEKSPVACIVVYGNRAYEDTLLELKDIMVKNGGLPIACAAFIGEHSFSCEEAPVAVARPDAADFKKAEEFGKKIKERLSALKDETQIPEITVPGNHPYKELPPSGPVDFIAVNNDCIKCGTCVDVCPVDAIDKDNPTETDTSKCILCCACIKNCPESARTIKEGGIMDTAKRLSATCSDRKEPVSFF